MRTCITVDEILACGDHQISAGPWWFRGGIRRVDALLADFQYERIGRARWEVGSGDDRALSTAAVLVPALDHTTNTEIVVAILGHQLFSELPS